MRHVPPGLPGAVGFPEDLQLRGLLRPETGLAPAEAKAGEPRPELTCHARTCRGPGPLRVDAVGYAYCETCWERARAERA